jgi:transcriptional regulator GlxA family with amidase domain
MARPPTKKPVSRKIHKTTATSRSTEGARTRVRRGGGSTTPSQSRRIVMLTHPQGQILDVVGPLEVFDTASRFPELRSGRGLRDAKGPLYRVEVVAAQAGPVAMSSGIEVVASRSISQVRGPVDTLMVAGGTGTLEHYRDPGLIRWIQRTATRARRVASICSGAFLLAEAGLLDGRRVTTHWGSCAGLAAMYPEVEVDPDPIFVKDGDVYTSAGVTAGMDLPLALV